MFLQLELKMLRNKCFVWCFALSVLFVGVFYSQEGQRGASSSDAVARLAESYLERAEESFDDGNLAEAYKQVTLAMKLTKSTDSEIIPNNVLIFARTVYRNRLNQIQNHYDADAFIDIKENLASYPEVGTPEITKLVKQIETRVVADEKAADKQNQQEFYDRLEQTNKSSKETIDKIAESIESSNEATKAMTEQMTENMSKAVSEMQRSGERTNKQLSMIVLLIVGIMVVILIVVMLIIVIVRAAAKHSQIQQQQYAEAFKLLAQNQSQTNQLMIGGIAGLYSDDGLKLAGSSTWSQSALPEPEETPEEKEELRELAAKCEDLGAKIDQVTARKNNSKNVSELVFKLATRLGCRQYEAMVYFCASMVYDAGFLSVDENLLSAEDLTDEQRKELNKHIDMAEDHLQFVPKRYWQVFDDAARFHHENMDGSGLHGKKGDEIPKIARIIRVADSFNALSSRRAYRGGTDKDSAVEKLESQPNIYDKDVITALKDIV